MVEDYAIQLFPTWLLPPWLFGVVFVLCPQQVLRFYRWFLRADRPRVQQLEARHIRNSGIVWLVVMAMFTYAEWRWPS